QITNNGSGVIQLTWSGQPVPVTVPANSTYAFAGVPTGLSVTLMTTDAFYDLSTNGSIQSVQAGPGVTSVDLSVRADAPSGVPFVGAGDVESVTLPAGTVMGSPSSLNVSARGDLGNVVAATGGPAANAMNLTFENLTGSITGFGQIMSLTARGWLGD